MLTAEKKAKELMDHAIELLKKQLMKVRTGRATATMFENVRVDYYGSLTPIAQTGTITIPEPRTILIKPYDKDLTPYIVKAIKNAGLGLNPINEGDKLRINIPQMTEELRRKMVKELGTYEEDAKIQIRKARQEANNIIKSNDELSKDGVKDALEKIQLITNNYNEKIIEVIKNQAEEVMKV